MVMQRFLEKKWEKVLSFFFLLLLASCGNNVIPEVPAGPDGDFEGALLEGREIWGTHCASCHGPSGQGGRGAKLNDGKIFENYSEPEAMINVINNGKGQGMPAFNSKLTLSETEAVIRYIREILN